MNEKPSSPKENPAPPATNTIDPEAVCSECGAYGAFDFGGVMLCQKCYSEKGSCCPEFGKDDLWQKRESSQ